MPCMAAPQSGALCWSEGGALGWPAFLEGQPRSAPRGTSRVEAYASVCAAVLLMHSGTRSPDSRMHAFRSTVTPHASSLQGQTVSRSRNDDVARPAGCTQQQLPPR